MSKEKQIEEITNELIFTKNYGTLDAVAKHLYEKGYHKQEWISVKERLPEIYQYVLWSDGRSIVMDFRTSDGKLFEGDCHEPTHWMPLPELPKEKGV